MKTPFKMIHAKVMTRNGVRIFPIRSMTADWLSAKNKVTVKKMTDDSTAGAPGKLGRTPNSNVTAAVLGMASRGPMARMITMLRILAKVGLTMPASFSTVPPARAEAMIPNRGIPIPVSKNPSMAIDQLAPAVNPMNGGKMRSPLRRTLRRAQSRPAPRL